MTNKISPKKYIISKARNLPFHECLIDEDWQEKGLASIVISKKMPSGNYIIAIFLVDVFCLGVKNTGYRFNFLEIEYEEFIEEWKNNQNMVDINIAEIHNIIYGAIDYASDLGFQPHVDFNITEHFLNPDYIDDGIDEIEFNKDGKPLFVEGPDDNATEIINTLRKNIGEENYDFIASGSGF